MKITITFVCVLFIIASGCKREPQSTPPVSEWSKVKIGRAGDIYVNKQQRSWAEFATECARLKKVGGAIVLFLDAPDSVASPAQAEVMRKIVETGVAMKAVLKESDLE